MAAAPRALARNHSVTEGEDDMGWLKRAAPQFHTQPEALPDVFETGAAGHGAGADSDEDASGSESEDGSDSSDEEDPLHPYNVPADAYGWHNDGSVAYLGNN